MPISNTPRPLYSCARSWRLRACTLVFAALAFTPLPARATTVVPLTFNDLIIKADVIFVGDVVDVHPYTLRTRSGTIVKTRVTFRVTDPVYGTTSLVEVFDFLGGEAEGIGLKVEGMPTFAVGDRRVVFASRAPSVSPIVGFTQGLLRVRRDANGVDRVFTAQGVPVSRPQGIGSKPAMPTLMPNMSPASLTLPDLRASIVEALAEAHKR